jgi:hypothetical protein
MSNNSILVLGSKPGSLLPKIKFQKIYTANGAAARSNFYKKINPNINLICVTGFKSFSKDFRVRSRIIKSNPNKLIFRFKKNELPILFKNKCAVKTMNYIDQWNFQKQFFYHPNFSLLIGELSYKENFINKIKKLLRFFFKRNLQGTSTGVFSILLALYENPKSKIIVAGIGLSGGRHFYENSRNKTFNYNSRSAVDQYLIKRLKKKYKSRIYSVDKDFVKISKTRFFEKK